ncbi:MAG: hypothetical protein ABIH03_07610 [Pseudomonadota bacterium]
MAAGDLVQTGTAVEVGFNSYTNTNLIMEAVVLELGDADVKPIKGEQNATVTKIITDPRDRIELRGIIKAAATELATIIAMSVGSILTVNNVKYFLAAAPRVEMGPEEARCTLTAVREDSMASTYDA